MALNNDGLEAGSIVDFETIVRVTKQREAEAKNGGTNRDEKPKRRSRKQTGETGESSVSGVLRSEAAEEAESE